MGLRTAARIDARRQDAAAGNPDNGQSTLSDQLLAFIPAETLAPTVALFGFFADEAWWWRGIVVLIAVVLTPIWVWINYVNAAQTTEARRKFPFVAAAISTVAYLLWVGSIPSTPYLHWGWWSLQLGTGLVLLGGFVLFGLSQVHVTWRLSHQPVPQPAGD
jgi:hypothetical protein